MCLTASLNLNAKYCRDNMQEGGRNVEATGSTRYHITLWNKIGSDRTSWYIDGLIHSVFAGSPTLISIWRLGHPNPNSLLLHYRCIPCLKTIVGSVRYVIILLKYSLFYYIVEHYQTFLHCWAIPNLNTLLRYPLSYYIATQFPNTNTLVSYTQCQHVLKI